MIARVSKDIGCGGNPDANKRDLEEAVYDAREALNNLQQRVTIIDDNEFLIIEN